MTQKSTLSVVLATRNEQANLDRCLASIAKIADEIVIADEDSSDETVKIAKKFKARVIPVAHKENFHINKNVAISAAKSDWVLQLDADEVVSDELADEITMVINDKTSKVNGYWINRRNWFLDRFLKKGGQYPDPTLRLYRNGKGKLAANDVHEQAEVDGEVGWLSNDLFHYRDTSFEKYLEGFNRYSSFAAVQLRQQNIQFSVLNTIKYLLILPVATFIKLFVRHRGYVDGRAGFIFSLYSGLIHPVAYIKFWQHKFYPEK